LIFVAGVETLLKLLDGAWLIAGWLEGRHHLKIWHGASLIRVGEVLPTLGTHLFKPDGPSLSVGVPHSDPLAGTGLVGARLGAQYGGAAAGSQLPSFLFFTRVPESASARWA